MCGYRDFKPENLLLRTVSANETNLNQPLSVGDLQLRLIDFGSAVDKHSIEQLYGSEGPSDDEQTAEYAPPEALLARYVIFVCCQQQTAVPDCLSLYVQCTCNGFYAAFRAAVQHSYSAHVFFIFCCLAHGKTDRVLAGGRGS